MLSMAHLVHVTPEQLVVLLEPLHELAWGDHTGLLLAGLDLYTWQAMVSIA
jgi:hypothetical protein